MLYIYHPIKNNQANNQIDRFSPDLALLSSVSPISLLPFTAKLLKELFIFSVSISSTLFLFSAHPGGFPPTLLHWRDLYQVINDLHFGKEKLILCPHFTWPFDSFGYTRSILRFWNTFFSRCLYLTPLDFPVSLATLFFLFLYWFLFFYETPLFFLVSLPLHIYCLRHHT